MATKVVSTLTKEEQERIFKPKGAALDLLLNKSPEILIEGPAGTGKSRTCLEKIYILCVKYPNIRVLITRKTYKSITQSVRVTFESKVMTTGAERVKFNQLSQEYRFSNGSKIILAGMNEPDRIKSAEYDIIYVNEATELTEVDYEILTTRVRNGQMPYQQIIADCNPDAPNHWLNKRAESGKMVRLKSRHEDNPSVTPEYLQRLDDLTGVRKLRLRDGLWVAAEGLIYNEWDESKHLINRFKPPREWPRYISIDFGFTNPFVCQWWAVDPKDNCAYLYREIYMTRQLVEDMAHKIHELSSGETFQALITDHDAEDRATLERHITHPADECPSPGTWSTTKAKKEVEGGIQLVKMRMAFDRIKIMRDCTVDIDPNLRDFGKPTRTQDEIGSYVWDQVDSQRLGQKLLEAPKKKDDHGMDAMRYFIMYIDDPQSAALRNLFKAPARMEVKNQASPDAKSKWLAFFRTGVS